MSLLASIIFFSSKKYTLQYPKYWVLSLLLFLGMPLAMCRLLISFYCRCSLILRWSVGRGKFCLNTNESMLLVLFLRDMCTLWLHWFLPTNIFGIKKVIGFTVMKLKLEEARSLPWFKMIISGWNYDGSYPCWVGSILPFALLYWGWLPCCILIWQSRQYQHGDFEFLTSKRHESWKAWVTSATEPNFQWFLEVAISTSELYLEVTHWHRGWRHFFSSAATWSGGGQYQ